MMPAIHLAAWEWLKNDPNYGGQLVREELDGLTTQFTVALCGLGVSLFLLTAQIVRLSVLA